MSMFNHGYYNLNPKWFWDFYTQNGFKVKRLFIRHPDGIYNIVEVGSRYKGVPEESVLLCLAQRIKVKEFQFPIDGQ